MAYSFDPDVYEPDDGRDHRIDFWTDVLLAAFQAVPKAQITHGGAHGYLDRLLHEAVWGVTVPVHTDASKYFWQRYLSEAVEKKFRQACSLKGRDQRSLVQGLRHEHVIEVNKLMNQLRSAAANGRSPLRAVLATAVACVVTVEEHTSLGSARSDGWKRYKDRVGVWDRSQRAWLSIP